MKSITQEEAWKKFCPFMSNPVIDDKGHTKVVHAICQAQSCMAWQDNMISGKCLLIPDEK